MQLSLHSDYALRALIYLGTRPGETISTREMSSAYGISKHHLVRVVQTLGSHGYVKLIPGRSGGVTLAMAPRDIRLGDVVRQTEPNLILVECFDRATNTCPIAPACALIGYLHEALRRFIGALNEKTLEDVLANGQDAKLTNIFVQIQNAQAQVHRKRGRSGAKRSK